MGGSHINRPRRACRSVVLPERDGPTMHQLFGVGEEEGSSNVTLLKRGGLGWSAWALGWYRYKVPLAMRMMGSRDEGVGCFMVSIGCTCCV